MTAVRVLAALVLLAPAVHAHTWKLGVMGDAHVVPGHVGLRVHGVFHGSPAEALRLRTGDELVLVDGRRINDAAGLRRWMGPRGAVTLVVKRGHRLYSVEARFNVVPLGEPMIMTAPTWSVLPSEK